MQVQDDAGAGLAGGGQSAPAKRRGNVMGVHDARAGSANRFPDLLRPQPAPQQTGGGADLREHARVALEDLGVLAEVLADQPREVINRTFLPTGDAVAVVEEKNHDRRSVFRV